MTERDCKFSLVEIKKIRSITMGNWVNVRGLSDRLISLETTLCFNEMRGEDGVDER